MVHETLLPSITGALSTAGLAQVEDVRGRDSTWVFNNYGSMLNKNMIFRQMPSFNQQLRSLAVLNAGFVFNNTAQREIHSWPHRTITRASSAGASMEVKANSLAPRRSTI